MASKNRYSANLRTFGQAWSRGDYAMRMYRAPAHQTNACRHIRVSKINRFVTSRTPQSQPYKRLAFSPRNFRFDSSEMSLRPRIVETT